MQKYEQETVTTVDSMNEQVLRNSLVKATKIFRGQKFIVENFENVNPAEPLGVEDNTYGVKGVTIKDVGTTEPNIQTDAPTEETNLPKPEEKPVKKIIRNSQKCLSNLAQEMSLTLQQSMACLDDIFFRARRCLSDIEDNDRRYHIEKEKRYEFHRRDNITTLMPVIKCKELEENESSIEVVDQMNKTYFFKTGPCLMEEKVLQTDISIVHKECNVLDHLENVCKNIVLDLKATEENIKRNLGSITTVEGDQKPETPDSKPISQRKRKKPLLGKTKSKTGHKLAPTVKIKSLKPPCLREVEKHTSQSHKKRANNIKKMSNKDSVLRINGEAITVRIPRRQRSEGKKMPQKGAKYSDSLWFSPNRKTGESLISQDSDFSLKSNQRKQTGTPSTCSHGTDCKCGVEVKSSSFDVRSSVRMQWIKKSSELGHNINPEFMDILDDIKPGDVERFQSEYPRRDNIIPIPRKCVQDTLLYKLVYDKSLGIWDLLLKSRFSGLRHTIKDVKSKYKNKPTH